MKNRRLAGVGMAGLLLAGAVGIASGEVVEVRTAEGRSVKVTALTDNVIRVENRLEGEQPSGSVPSRGAKSGLKERSIDKGDVGKVTDGSERVKLITGSGIEVSVDKGSGALTISDKGRMVYDSGKRGRDAKGRRTLELLSSETESLYGGGERGYSLNLQGDTLVMYNRQNYGYTEGDKRIKQMNITMPLVVSPEGFALLMDDYAAGELTTGSPLKYASESPDAVSYYYISSPAGFAGLTEELTGVTGRQDIAPLWSLGYITSKYGYKTAAETDSVVNRLKNSGYPLDGIVLDLYWYGKEEDMGRLAWEPEQWGDHKKLLKSLKDKGVRLTAISQPYVLRNGKGIENYENLSRGGMFGKDSIGGVKEVKIWVGEGGMLDVSNPDTRAWLRERYRQLTDEGVGGWWGDLGEPEVHPEGMHHANGLSTREYHNIYGNEWSSIIYDLFREEYPDERLMTLMRGGTTGLQRYSVFPWSTDVSRSWEGLQPQVKIMLNAGLSGLGYMSHDVGGFAVDKQHPKDDELYVRWLQLGLYSPVLRTHSSEYAEPFCYPEYEPILKKLIKARYEWLPYNYTLAYENATKGTPLVRLMGMYDADPSAYDHITDEYLWGRDLLVAPVMTPGATSREVTFPSGEWVSVDNPTEVYSGGSTAEVAAPLEVIPTFARGGALIAKARYPMDNTGDYRPGRYTVEYYPTAGTRQSECTIFEDDLHTPRSTEKGEYALVNISAGNTPEAIELKISAEGSYSGMPAKREISFEIHNVDSPAKVIGGKSSYDKRTRTLTVKATGDEVKILKTK